MPNDYAAQPADASPPAPSGEPWWRRIVAFPLVAMLLALGSIALVVGGLGALFGVLGAGDLPETTLVVVNGIVTPLVVIAVMKLVIARLGEEPRDDLPFGRRLGDLPAGALAGLALMALVVGVVALLGGYTVSGWGSGTSWPFILFVAGTQAAVFEEVLMRGILFRFLEEFGGSWFALALSSALFGFGHYWNPNATLFSSLAIAIEAGIMLGAAYMLTRNLWLAIGIHFGWNVTQGYLFDVPVSGNDVDGLVVSHPAGSELVSGGMFGVEASVVALVLATGFGLWLLRSAIQRGHLVRPWWVRRREDIAIPA